MQEIKRLDNSTSYRYVFANPENTVVDLGERGIGNKSVVFAYYPRMRQKQNRYSLLRREIRNRWKTLAQWRENGFGWVSYRRVRLYLL